MTVPTRLTLSLYAPYVHLVFLKPKMGETARDLWASRFQRKVALAACGW
jgi:hypothetical protein